MEIHLLDMGQTKYGDCILITRGNRKILIDAGHVNDVDSITSQLSKILNADPPFDIDLFIVTHCHSDHIGCAPTLVSEDIIRPVKALLADEKLGWGRDSGGDGPADALESPKQKALLYALQEEDHSSLTDSELLQFIQDAGTLEDKYIGMIETLEGNGIEVVRYGRDNHKALEKSFKDFGLKILGPTVDHLLICAEALSNAGDFVGSDSLKNTGDDDDQSNIIRAYRKITTQIIADAVQDKPGPGAAKNNQSIVLKVQADGWSAMLGGDMQFAKAEISDLNDYMVRLRRVVANEGPYDFVKTSHHTSYNGLNEEVLSDYPSTKLFAHSGGRRDATHPDEGALQLLEANKDRLLFARTDRNGLITIKRQGGKVVMTPQKGKLNNFSANTVGDEGEESKEGSEEFPNAPVVIQSKKADGDTVEIVAKIPAGMKVHFSIEVEAMDNGNKSSLARSITTDSIGLLGSGRKLPKLLFVTSSPLLKRNIGEKEADQVIKTIETSSQVDLLDLPGDINLAQAAANLVRQKLLTDVYEGVVIIGGYDVIPSHQLDALDPGLRQQLVQAGKDGLDADDFVIWSDDLYGDKDGDLLPEVPVSRIPDARRADVVMAALHAPHLKINSCFGIRNYARPFADNTFQLVPGGPSLLNISEEFGPSNIGADMAQGAVYYMLHGSDRDATRFWGETADGDEYEAISIENIPKSVPGTIVFTGCCWGALTVTQPAVKVRPNYPLTPKSPEQSIAISYLLSGALAFVGCTGSHYSPLQQPFNYYGKPMHDHFWKLAASDMPPAKALFESKKEYAKNIPHSRTDVYSKAIELKILRQYCCLGLGW